MWRGGVTPFPAWHRAAHPQARDHAKTPCFRGLVAMIGSRTRQEARGSFTRVTRAPVPSAYATDNACDHAHRRARVRDDAARSTSSERSSGSISMRTSIGMFIAMRRGADRNDTRTSFRATRAEIAASTSQAAALVSHGVTIGRSHVVGRCETPRGSFSRLAGKFPKIREQ